MGINFTISQTIIREVSKIYFLDKSALFLSIDGSDMRISLVTRRVFWIRQADICYTNMLWISLSESRRNWNSFISVVQNIENLYDGEIAKLSPFKLGEIHFFLSSFPEDELGEFVLVCVGEKTNPDCHYR